MPNKAKIRASKVALESVGIDQPITGLTGTIKTEYNSGYVTIEVEHKYMDQTVKSDFDIPMIWLEIIK